MRGKKRFGLCMSDRHLRCWRGDSAGLRASPPRVWLRSLEGRGLANLENGVGSVVLSRPSWLRHCYAKGEPEVKGHPEFTVQGDFLSAAPRLGLATTLEGVEGLWSLCPSTVVWAGAPPRCSQSPALFLTELCVSLGKMKGKRHPKVRPTQPTLLSPGISSREGGAWWTVSVGS